MQPNQWRAARGPPGRHARFGGVFVRRYNAEDKGAFVRNNALVSDLPEIPQLQKANKSMVCLPFPNLLDNKLLLMMCVQLQPNFSCCGTFLRTNMYL